MNSKCQVHLNMVSPSVNNMSFSFLVLKWIWWLNDFQKQENKLNCGAGLGFLTTTCSPIRSFTCRIPAKWDWNMVYTLCKKINTYNKVYDGYVVSCLHTAVHWRMLQNEETFNKTLVNLRSWQFVHEKKGSFWGVFAFFACFCFV